MEIAIRLGRPQQMVSETNRRAAFSKMSLTSEDNPPRKLAQLLVGGGVPSESKMQASNVRAFTVWVCFGCYVQTVRISIALSNLPKY